ncbi:hypothetical protein BDM02DRAFT_3109634 [Thelephora ganbajun]|uniref:Uncharacterized protein n=1 Tax=Thelephora ganbajun TaxID=370292 RepID=A0ACB6ZRQ1_THEGA|nr:hypothetical protein BDM02DRAFT_3109634 [Thelephora ganbajun]
MVGPNLHDPDWRVSPSYEAAYFLRHLTPSWWQRNMYYRRTVSLGPRLGIRRILRLWFLTLLRPRHRQMNGCRRRPVPSSSVGSLKDLGLEAIEIDRMAEDTDTIDGAIEAANNNDLCSGSQAQIHLSTFTIMGELQAARRDPGPRSYRSSRHWSKETRLLMSLYKRVHDIFHDSRKNAPGLGIGWGGTRAHDSSKLGGGVESRYPRG